MLISNNKLQKYILNHTENESKILKELNRQTHLKTLNPRMLSGHLQGKILQMLSKMIQPKHILEIGTFTGYSAISLAQGLKKNGKLYTIEINEELVDFTKSYFKKANLNEKIEFHIGDALKIIPKINVKFDLVFIDAEQQQYLNYYNLIFNKVKSGGFIIADNALWDGKVVKKTEEDDLYTKGILEFNKFVNNDTRVENVLFPVRDGLMVLRKR